MEVVGGHGVAFDIGLGWCSTPCPSTRSGKALLTTRIHIRSLRVNCVHGGYMHLSNHPEQSVP